MSVAVLAVDGGNSKTDVALVGHDGTLLGYARGPGSNHQVVGPDAAIKVLTDCVSAAAGEAAASSTASINTRISSLQAVLSPNQHRPDEPRSPELNQPMFRRLRQLGDASPGHRPPPAAQAFAGARSTFRAPAKAQPSTACPRLEQTAG